MAPKSSRSKQQGPGAVAFAKSTPSVLRYMRPMDTDDELSSVNGFESPRDLRSKLEAGKPLRSAGLELKAMEMWDFDAYSGRKVRTVEDEIEAMGGWDFDVGSARLVGVSHQFASGWSSPGGGVEQVLSSEGSASATL